MLRKTHIVTSEMIYTGATIGLQPYVQHANLMTYTIGAIGVAIGAQLPDIDNPNTRIARRLGIFSRIFAPIKHRTYSHTLWAVILMGLIGFTLNHLPGVPAIPNLMYHQLTISVWGLFGFAMGCGYFLHLCEDSFSVQGVGWLYPFGHHPHQYHGIPFFHRHQYWFYYHTGSGMETLMLLVFSCIWMGELYQLIMH